MREKFLAGLYLLFMCCSSAFALPYDGQSLSVNNKNVTLYSYIKSVSSLSVEPGMPGVSHNTTIIVKTYFNGVLQQTYQANTSSNQDNNFYVTVPWNGQKLGNWSATFTKQLFCPGPYGFTHLASLTWSSGISNLCYILDKPAGVPNCWYIMVGPARFKVCRYNRVPNCTVPCGDRDAFHNVVMGEFATPQPSYEFHQDWFKRWDGVVYCWPDLLEMVAKVCAFCF